MFNEVERADDTDEELRVTQFEGPLPPPTILDGYNAVWSGAGRKIIENSLEEAKHRRQLEREAAYHENRQKWFSLCVGSVFAILTVVLGAFGYFLGASWPATALVGFIATVVGFFVRIPNSSRED